MNAWPYQSTPYLSALPGVGGPGLDVSSGDKPSKIYFVTSLENVKQGGPDPRGPNCYSGTLWYCWYADQGDGFHKWIVPLVSGYSFLGRGMNTPQRDNFDYVGHAAPGPGLIVQTASMNVRASNSRIWHMPSWLGDLPSVDGPDKFKADQRDALSATDDENELRKIAFINCEARFAMDESVELWYDSIGASWIRGAIYDPLHTPPGFTDGDDDHHGDDVDHGFGAIFSGLNDYALMLQSLNAHTTDRNPLVGSTNYAHINNLHYNHGRPDGGRGAGVKIDDNGDHNADAGRSMRANVVGNVTVRGPNQGDQITLVEVQDITEGSAAHSAFNSQFGWDAPTSQADFWWLRETPASYLKPTLRVGAWPLGLGFDYDGVLKPARDPLHPTRQEGLAFTQLMRETVGCMPSRRYLFDNGVNKILDQIDSVIRGDLPTDSQYINSVNDIGGWPEIAELTIDPVNPTSDYHAPMPLDADRDELLQEGVFCDGSSKAGYSRLRAWVIEQYFYVLGR